MDKKIVAASAIGLLAVAAMLAGSYYFAENIASTSRIFDPYSLKDVMQDGVRRAMDSGTAVETVAEVHASGVITEKEIAAGFNPRRAYYAEEFASDVDVSVKFECKTSACSVEGKLLKIGGNGFLSARTACSKTREASAECTVALSDYTGKPGDGAPASMDLASKAKNPLQRQLLVEIDSKIQAVMLKQKEFESENPFGKAASLWEGKPQETVADTIATLADLAVIMNMASGDSGYFFEAQQKYGLKYPDGSESAEEFVESMRRISVPKAGSTEAEEECLRRLDSDGGFVARGMQRLAAKLAIVPLCLLQKRLDDMGQFRFSWAGALFSFPEDEPIGDKAHRALAVFEFERQRKMRREKGSEDAYPAVAAENQVIWLNRTGNASAAEKITFYKNAAIDFSRLEGYRGFKEISVEREGAYPLRLENNILKASENIVLYLKTKRECDGECAYSTVISDSAV